MTIEALQQIRAMRGSTRPHLMLGDDSHLYVVKFQSAVQTSRQLVSELLGSELARWAGLPIPEAKIVNVCQVLIDGTPALATGLKLGIGYRAGLQFGSRMIGGEKGGQVWDYIPATHLHTVENLSTVAGMFAFDRWTSNLSPRQAVFFQRFPKSNRRLYFIDNGGCFAGGQWSLSDFSQGGLLYSRDAYRDVVGWESFEPYLSRMVTLQPKTLEEIVKMIPRSWYDGCSRQLGQLLDALLLRRSRIHELIAKSREANPALFPGWKPTVFVPASFGSRTAQVPLQSETTRLSRTPEVSK